MKTYIQDGRLFAIRNLPSPSVEAPKLKTTRTDARFQEYVAGRDLEDAMIYGVVAKKDGKRIDPTELYPEAPPAAAPNPAGLKEGDLVMCGFEKIRPDNFIPARFIRFDDDGDIRANFLPGKVIGCFTNWRLPTPAELAAHEWEKEGGWIEHDGSFIPDVSGKTVQVRYENGVESKPQFFKDARGPWWLHKPAGDGQRNNIIAYRILPTTGRD